MLSMFPRSMRGRQKRNATFPGIKATVNVMQEKEGNESNSQKNNGSRTRYHSCQSDDKTAGLKENVPPSWSELINEHQYIKPDESKNNTECNNNEVQTQKTRRYRQSRSSRGQRSKSDGVSKMFPLSLDRPKWNISSNDEIHKGKNKRNSDLIENYVPLNDRLSASPTLASKGVPDGCGYDTESRAYVSLCSNFIHDMTTEEWSRHWFVLKETAFMFYRDASCEEKGILDGFIDLCLIKKIEPVNLSKYYGFKITTPRVLTLEKALPPSPPVTRTPISRVKEKARSRSNSRSRNSSRRSKSASSPVLYSDDADGSTSDTQNTVTKLSHSTIAISYILRILRLATSVVIIIIIINVDSFIIFHRITIGMKDVHQVSVVASYNRCRMNVNVLGTMEIHLREDVDKLTNENLKLKKDQEELHRIREDITDLKSQCNWKEIVIQRQRSENQSLKNNLETGKEEINSLFNKLSKFSKDKLVLTKEIHDLETKLEVHENIQKEPTLVIMEDFDKETEVDNAKVSLTKAQSDIRNLKKELRQAHCSYDELELYTMKMKHDMDAVKQENQSDSRMMAERIEDLTSKLSSAERTTRQLKQKLVKAENRQERRSRSLRGGKESLTISKEMEAKLTELENKMKVIDGIIPSDCIIPSDDLSPLSAQNDGEKNDSASIFLRLNTLNSKVSSAVDHIETKQVTETPTREDGTTHSISNMISDSKIAVSNSDNVIQQLKMRLKYIENIMNACKKRINEVICRILHVECHCSNKVNLAELKEDLETIYEVILGQCSSSTESNNASQLCNAVSKMQRLLHGQSQQICNQRRKLKVAGLHTMEVERKLMAEKLALETVIMKYMACVIHSPEHRENTVAYWTCELQILSENMDQVESITSGSDRNDFFLTMKRVLKSILSSPVQSNVDSVSKTIYSTSNSSLEDVQDQTHTSDDLKANFESLKLKFIKVTAAIDEKFQIKVHAIVKSFFSNQENSIDILSDSNQNVKKILNTLKFHESWDVAREIVNEGIVKSEMQIGHLYRLIYPRKHDQHDKQMKSHRVNFEKELSQSLTCKISDDLHRLQYEAEIEQLKHMIKDLECKHKFQIESLQFEKEQALADETRATMAALKALKRVHEEEIQKELAKVKEVLASNSSNRSPYSCKSSSKSELDEIKEEIKNISEKMTSPKISDSIMKERVDSLTHQLVDANSQQIILGENVFYITSGLSALVRLPAFHADAIPMRSSHVFWLPKRLRLLEINEGEILRKNEELAEMRNELESLKMRENQLVDQCSQLQENLNVKKKVKEDEMKNFLLKLEAVTSENEGPLSSLRFYPSTSEHRTVEKSEAKPRKPLKMFFNYKRGLLKSTVSCVLISEYVCTVNSLCKKVTGMFLECATQNQSHIWAFTSLHFTVYVVFRIFTHFTFTRFHDGTIDAHRAAGIIDDESTLKSDV
ncbi:Protein outspread [Nymphon striatum]|nr:Protein outspread [Nymphon striatum]